MSAKLEGLARRFWPKVNKNGPVPTGTLAVGNCWDWTGANKGGDKVDRGVIWFDGKYRRAHIMAWLLEYGQVPSGLVLDHICRRPICVRPTHLRAVPQDLNRQNRAIESRVSRSGVRNVAWDARKQSWRAEVYAGKVRHRGPRRDTVEAAAEDARQLRLKWHTQNDVDRLNPPETGTP